MVVRALLVVSLTCHSLVKPIRYVSVAPGDTTGTTAFTTSPVAGGSLVYLPLLKRHLGIHATEWEQTPEDAATAEPGEDPGMLMSISAMPVSSEME